MDALFSLRQTPPPISKAKLSCGEHEYTSHWVCDVMLLSARGFRWCHLVGQLRRGSIIDTATRVCSSTNHSDSQLSHHIIGAKITTLKRPVGRRVVPRFYVDFHVPTRWLSDLTSGKSFVTPCRSWSSPGRLVMRSSVRNILCRVLFPVEPTPLGVRPGSRTRDAHFGQLSTRTQYLGECQDAVASLRFAMVILALSVSSCV